MARFLRISTTGRSSRPTSSGRPSGRSAVSSTRRAAPVTLEVAIRCRCPLLPRGAAELCRKPAAPARREQGHRLLGRGQGKAAAQRGSALRSGLPPRAGSQGHGQPGDRIAGFVPNMPETVIAIGSPPQASAQSGHPAGPISGTAASSTASARSARACPPTAPLQAARPTIR